MGGSGAGEAERAGGARGRRSGAGGGEAAIGGAGGPATGAAQLRGGCRGQGGHWPARGQLIQAAPPPAAPSRPRHLPPPPPPPPLSAQLSNGRRSWTSARYVSGPGCFRWWPWLTEQLQPSRCEGLLCSPCRGRRLALGLHTSKIGGYQYLQGPSHHASTIAHVFLHASGIRLNRITCCAERC